MKFSIKYLMYFSALCLFLAPSCMDYGPFDREDIVIDAPNGLFIASEGNFFYGTATLAFYDPDTKRVENEIFLRVNGIPLGDVAQSVTVKGDLAYVIVNNSGVINVINKHNFKLVKRIRGLVSPRHIFFVNERKAYITDLYAREITILDPLTYNVKGSIKTHGTGKQHSTEQMVNYDKYVFTNCWSYDNKILVIDSEQDTVVDSITVGLQPRSMAIDHNNKVWVMCDGGYRGSSAGQEIPAIYRIDAATREIEKKFEFKFGDMPTQLCMNASRDTLYYINRDVWRMRVEEDNLPKTPFLKYAETKYYSLTVDPRNSQVYVADAIDYSQRGVVYRFTPDAVPIDTFRVGINPGAFCFK